MQPGSKIVNAIVVRGRDQIMLKVTVAEVERDVIKQLGINLSGSLNYGTAVVNFNNTNPFSAYGQPLTSSSHQRRTEVGDRDACRPWNRPVSSIRSPSPI